MVGACLEHAPVVLAEIAQVDALLLVVEHVHALVGVELVRHVLIAELGLDQVVAAAHGEAEGMGAAFIGRGADFIEGQRMTDTAG